AFALAARASMMPMRYRRDSGCAAPVARAVVASAVANPPPTPPRNVLRVIMSSARWRQNAAERRRSSIGPKVRGRVSGCRHRPAVDDVFGPRNGGRTRRRQKCDQIGYLLGLGRSAERNAAKRIHDDLSTA